MTNVLDFTSMDDTYEGLMITFNNENIPSRFLSMVANAVNSRRSGPENLDIDWQFTIVPVDYAEQSEECWNDLNAPTQPLQVFPGQLIVNNKANGSGFKIEWLDPNEPSTMKFIQIVDTFEVDRTADLVCLNFLMDSSSNNPPSASYQLVEKRFLGQVTTTKLFKVL